MTRDIFRFLYKIVVGIILLLISVIFQNWILSIILGAVSYSLLAPIFYRNFIYKPKILKAIINNADEVTDEVWINLKGIHPDKHKDLIVGDAFVDNVQFGCGVKYYTHGMYIQFICARKTKVLYFKWSSIEYWSGFVFERDGKSQDCIQLLLCNSHLLILPWDRDVIMPVLNDICVK